MLSSFRGRLVVTVITLVAVTALVVAGLSFVLVRRSLRAQLVEDAVSRAEFNIGVLASEDILSLGADRHEFEESGLAARFLLRGTTGVFVEFDSGEEPFLSSLSLVEAPAAMAPQLRRIVADGELGYQFLELGEEPSLVVAGRRPPNGPDFYFVSSVEAVELALAQLRRVLAGAGLGALLVGALVAGLIARRLLRPVRHAGEGAQRMAAGDLGVRLPVAPGDDELARLTESFNVMAASLEEKVAELEEAHRRERRFVADVSHELRTPLTGLVNEAAMAARHLAATPGEPRRVGELLVNDVARLRILVEDLLEISRLEASPATVDVSDVDLAGFVSAVVAERHPAAEVRFAGITGPVRIDRRGLERILGNLLDNARTHAPGADVAVEVRVVDDLLAVDVADTGPGIATQDLSRIFDRLAVGDASRQAGSGLGLAIARQHAVRLGGRLTARNRPEGGSVFEIRLPVTDSLPERDRPEKVVAHPEEEVPEGHPPKGVPR